MEVITMENPKCTQNYLVEHAYWPDSFVAVSVKR